MHKKVLITGGAGFLGINLIRHLFHKGITDIVSLDLAEFDYPEKDKVTVIEGDIRDPAIVKQAMQGVHWVIHTAAALPLYTEQEIFSTDIDGTRILLEAARDQQVERFVHISSTAVYGIPDHHPLVEDDPLIGVGPYGKAKIEAENVCLSFREQGLCVPIIRPKSFVGPERLGVFALFYDWAKDGKNFPMIGSGDNRYQLLDVEDLAEATFLCLTAPADKANDIFNVGATSFTTMKEDYQAVLDRAGYGKRIIGFPAKPVIWTLRILEALKLSPLYKWVYETACEDSFVSTEKIERQLGFHPKYSNKQALVRNYEWYLENLASFEGKGGVSHRVPWKQGILKLFKHFF
jgi:nucleoside-diphosphate-sugar epimerase